jgi:sugar phosphate isomerase/epimerase
LRRCIAHAKRLGARLIRGFTFWDRGGFDGRLPEIVEKFREPVRILEETDMIMVLEFDPSVYATNAAKLTKVIDAIGSPRIRGLWDPGNDIYDPDGEIPYPDGYEIIKDRMAHMHLKDAAIVGGKPEGAPVGKGVVDLEGQFRRLIQDGYTGYVSLETHYRPSHCISEDLLAMPKGSAFAHGGYEATEESLILWQQLIERINT